MRTFPKDLKYFQKDDYFFAVVLGMDSAGYLIHERLGQCFFVELMVQRPGFKDEVQQIAEGFGVQVMQGYATRQAEQGVLRPIEKINRIGERIVFGGRQPPRVHLNVNIANSWVTASWWLSGEEIKDSARLPTGTTLLHDAQQKLITITQSGGNPGQIAAASAALGTILSQHIFQPGIQAQFTLALNKINESGGELNLQLEFGGEEELAQLSWELLREPTTPYNFLCTHPRIFLTRRYPRAMVPPSPINAPQKLLLIVGAKEGQQEANDVAAHWRAKGLELKIIDNPDNYELSIALADGPWDVMHIIAHGRPEHVRLIDTLNSNQLVNMARGNVRSAVVLSVCTSASANVHTDRAQEDAYDRGSIAWRGVAQGFIGAGVPNVLAWTNLAYVDECARVTPRWHETYLLTDDPRHATREARRMLVGGREYSFGWLAHFTG